MIKTVTLTGSEVKVTDLGGQNAAVKNLGSGSIYVSTKPNITAGADNVLEIPAGASEVVLDANGTVYIVCTGKVQCTGTPYATPNFKLPSSSSGGGGGTSDVTKEYVDAQDTTNLNLAKSYTDNAKSEIQTTIDTLDNTLNTHIADPVKHITAEERAAWNAKADTDTATTSADGLMSAADKEKLDGIYSTLNTHIADQVKHITAEERAAWNSKAELTDIPTELPANGGNADTVDGLHANEIASNPNLLINPDFKINQRGETVWNIGTSNKFFVDRWYSARTNLSLSDDGLMLAWNGTDGSDGWIQEKVETKALFGKTVTISVNANDKIYTITDTIPETVNATLHKAFTGTPLSISLTNHGGNAFAVVLHSTSTTPSLIRWIKCELGSVATSFIPPDPATELAKCQRYFIRLKNAFGWIGSGFTNKTLARCLIPLPTTMRISPTVTLNGKIYANTPTSLGAGAIECTTVRSDISYTQNAIGVSFDLPEGSTSIEPCFMQFRDSESYIDISAEL